MRCPPIVIHLAAVLALSRAFVALADGDDLRLDPSVAPTSQAIALELDADRDDYTGHTKVDLEVKKQVGAIRFHAEDLELTSIRLQGPGGPVPVVQNRGETGLVTLTPAASIPAGRYTLDLDFKNRFNTRSFSLYKVKSGDRSYLFTQFEAMAARQAFPCWDEPGFKIPYQLTLTVPEAHMAVSNTPIQEETSAGGRRRVVFEPTPPTPSYLLAIATGPFEVVDVPGMSIPTRILTVQGRSRLAAQAVRVTGPTLKALEQWFGSPYPYRKLDLIAAPEFMFGAMENPGAVVFTETSLLIDAATASVQQRKRNAEHIAHELAHMWFGDLVTMQWWNDLWLNEAFASWLADKVVQQLYPQLEMEIATVSEALGAMHGDARLTAKAVRAEMSPRDNPLQYVGTSYDKGEAVLGMFERWMGPETFQRGVRLYLEKHRWGNAVAADLWEGLSAASGKDIEAIMATFIEQPGVPLVTLERAGAGRIRLTQKRLLPVGQSASPQLWQIPITLRYPDGGRMRTQSLLLSGASQEFKLEASSQPAWIYPNADAWGYYRWTLPSDMLGSLTRDATRKLEPRERIALLDNLWTLLEAGSLKGGDYLEMIAWAGKDPQPQVIHGLLRALQGVRGSLVEALDEAQRRKFATWTAGLLKPALDRIGIEPRAGESEAVAALRPEIIGWLAIESRDPAVIAHCQQLAAKYEQDPRSVESALAEVALVVAASKGDRALFDRYRQRFETAQDPTDRSNYLGALGWFREAALVDAALRYNAEGPLRPHEMARIPLAMLEDPALRDKVFHWSMESYQRFEAKVPREFMAFSPWFAGGCSRARADEAKRFYGDPVRVWPGLTRELERLDEEVGSCVALRARESASVAGFLAKQR